jgi:hypothetical protein
MKGELYWHIGYAVSIAAALGAGLALSVRQYHPEGFHSYLSAMIAPGIILTAVTAFAAVLLIKCRPSTFLFGLIGRFFGKDVRDDEDSPEGHVR